MTTAGTPTGKIDAVAKWSLIIGPILVVVFNFLMPTNGIEPIDPENSDAYIKALGDNSGTVEIYSVLILLGIILYTRGIIGLWKIAPEGQSRYRMTVGVLGSTAALGLWAIVLGITLAESSIAEKLGTAIMGAQAGVAGAAESAAGTTIIAKTLHAGLFGIYQTASYVAYISLIPLGGGLAISGIVRKEFGWAIALIGLVTVVLVSIFPVKTEEGVMIFGVMALIWGIAFLATALQIARQDME
ncbi:MAG: hypothetical protein HOF01_10600 [Chloroflexi bacterium]|jgi:hypothetical protein|nr:hypothetical protein [Chloroflexota bacterium]